MADYLLCSLDSNGTQFYLSDAQGSLVSAFTNAAGGATMKSNQLFGPYGNVRYNAGSLNTAKGFIGQYNDGTGLDYFHARYYDPIVGVFLSADTVQGNAQGMNPYGYVNGNPETRSDPSGQFIISKGTGGSGPDNSPDMTPLVSPPPPPPPSTNSCTAFFVCGLFHADSAVVHVVAKVGDALTGISSIANDVGTIFNGNTSFWQKLGAVGDLALNVGMDVSMVMGVGEFARGAELFLKGGADVGEHLLESQGADLGEHTLESCGLSFAPATLVATSRGEQAIGTMQVGQKVWAYNPKAHKMELQPVLHVWINHDNDLVDLTLTTTTPAQRGKATTKTSETIHTNKKHPFLTQEKGFLPVGQITLGMHVLRANGTYGVVTGWKVVSGTQVMYNLEVAQDHTFTVGIEQWVVHNCGPDLLQNDEARSAVQKVFNAFRDHLTPDDIKGAWGDEHGFPIPKQDGGFWDHAGEVDNALSSGKNALSTFNRLISRGALSESDLCVVQCLISRISQTMDYVENIIHRDVWTPGAGIPPWWF